jgi:arabinofuranosyltransferase
VVAAVLLSSRAFVDYSTSGLGGALTNVLLVAACATFLWREDRRRIAVLAVLTGLLGVNRIDTVVLSAPLLLAALFEERSPRAALTALLGLIPLYLWLGFAWFYYGFPLPNTAYAKALGTGIPKGRVVSQGLVYLRESLLEDRVTLPVLMASLLWALVARKRRGLVVAGAISAHLVYVVWIGGDFMSGRFLVPPLVVAAVLLAWSNPVTSPRAGLGLAAAIVLLGLTSPVPNLLSGSGLRDEALAEDGVTDERAFYYQRNGLLAEQRHAWKDLGRVPEGPSPRELFVLTAAGRAAFEGGPGRHVIDDVGLGDPLLARLPARNPDVFWPGHVTRAIPQGYLQEMWTGEARIASEPLAAYYRDLRLVSRGPLWSSERLAAILRFASGENSSLLRSYLATAVKSEAIARVEESELPRHTPDGTPWHSRDVHLFTEGVVAIGLAARAHARELVLGLDGNDTYYALVGNEEGALCQPILVPPVSDEQSAGIGPVRIEVPEPAAEIGYTWARIASTRSRTSSADRIP